MDTITHGIAGALIGKAIFKGDDMLATRPMSRARVITWSVMLGSIFPDSDILRDFFSHSDLLLITWHRSITHSLVMLPLWALILAGITHVLARSRKWEAPSFAALAGIYGVGILSHILLD
jgi:inner membrane protein